MEKRIKIKKLSVPQSTPILNLNMTSMVWNISIGQLGLSGNVPSQILHTHSLADHARLEESP